jgi:predicted dehydrogenase
MIDAAVVGLGRWGQTLVEAVQGKSDRLRFTHAVSGRRDTHRDFAVKHRLVLVGDLAEALANPAVAAVVLATPHSLHVEQTIAVAKAGKAVLCEKPLALTLVEAERVVAACAEAGVVLGVGTDKRHFPAMRELFRIAESGELGRLLHLEAHFSNEVSAAMEGWRHAPGESPAGGMTGTGIHALDAMVKIAGPVRRVQAQLLSQKPPPDPLDSLSALLEFDGGVSGTIACVRSTPMYLRVHAFGRHGSAEVLGRTELVLRTSGAKSKRLTFDEADPIGSVRANLDAFADAVAGRSPFPISTREMLATVAACEAIADAVRA